MATPSSCHTHPHTLPSWLPRADAHVAAWPIHKSALKEAAAEQDDELDKEWD